MCCFDIDFVILFNVFCTTLIALTRVSTLVHLVMFQCSVGKQDIYHVARCSLSNDEPCEDDNEWPGPGGRK